MAPRVFDIVGGAREEEQAVDSDNQAVTEKWRAELYSSDRLSSQPSSQQSVSPATPDPDPGLDMHRLDAIGNAGNFEVGPALGVSAPITPPPLPSDEFTSLGIEQLDIKVPPRPARTRCLCVEIHDASCFMPALAAARRCRSAAYCCGC